VTLSLVYSVKQIDFGGKRLWDILGCGRELKRLREDTRKMSGYGHSRGPANGVEDRGRWYPIIKGNIHVFRAADKDFEYDIAAFVGPGNLGHWHLEQLVDFGGSQPLKVAEFFSKKILRPFESEPANFKSNTFHQSATQRLPRCHPSTKICPTSKHDRSRQVSVCPCPRARASRPHVPLSKI
jgi:hypothetical protein